MKKRILNLAMDGQIYDHQGNLFHPNRVQAKLYSAGWRIYHMKKVGMIRQIHWVDPKTGDGVTQGSAYDILREREKFPDARI